MKSQRTLEETTATMTIKWHLFPPFACVRAMIGSVHSGSNILSLCASGTPEYNERTMPAVSGKKSKQSNHNTQLLFCTSKPLQNHFRTTSEPLQKHFKKRRYTKTDTQKLTAVGACRLGRLFGSAVSPTGFHFALER